MRQGDGATDVLVGLTGVDAQTEVRLDGLVELGGCDLLHQADSLERLVELELLDLLRSGAEIVSMLPACSTSCGHRARALPHRCAPYCARAGFTGVVNPRTGASSRRTRTESNVTRRWSRPWNGRYQATIFLAASMSLALRSGILISAIFSELLVGELADLVALQAQRRPLLSLQLLLDEVERTPAECGTRNRTCDPRSP